MDSVILRAEFLKLIEPLGLGFSTGKSLLAVLKLLGSIGALHLVGFAVAFPKELQPSVDVSFLARVLFICSIYYIAAALSSRVIIYALQFFAVYNLFLSSINRTATRLFSSLNKLILRNEFSSQSLLSVIMLELENDFMRIMSTGAKVFLIDLRRFEFIIRQGICITAFCLFYIGYMFSLYLLIGCILFLLISASVALFTHNLQRDSDDANMPNEPGAPNEAVMGRYEAVVKGSISFFPLALSLMAFSTGALRYQFLLDKEPVCLNTEVANSMTLIGASNSGFFLVGADNTGFYPLESIKSVVAGGCN